MLNRYYAVGERIYDQEYGFFSGAYLRNLTKEELEKESFFKHPTIKVFRSFDEAKQYAVKEQKSALANAEFAKNTNIKKVSPIFDIDLNPNILGKLCSEQGKVDEAFYFYSVNTADINKANIIRAQFHNSDLATVEFKQPVQKRTCAIV